MSKSMKFWIRDIKELFEEKGLTQEHIKLKAINNWYIYVTYPSIPYLPPQHICYSTDHILTPQQVFEDIVQRLFKDLFVWELRKKNNLIKFNHVLKCLFDIKVIAEKQGKWKVIDVKKKEDTKYTRVYLHWNPVMKGWILSDPKHPDNIRIRKQIEGIEVPKLTVKYTWGSDIEVEEDTGIVSVPSMHGSDMVLSTVLEQTDKKVVIEKITIISNSPVVEYSLKPICSVRSKTEIYTIILDSKGDISVKTKQVDNPSWVEDIRSTADLVCNPFNTHVHHLLPKETKPKYQGQHLFITSADHYYVCLGNNNEWVLVNKNWIKIYKDRIPSVQREFLAMQLMGIQIK